MLFRKKVTKQEFTDTFQENNKIIKNKKQIANRYNTYFATIGPELEKEIDKLTGDENSYMYMQNSNSKSMFVTGVLENEVSSIVNNFHAKTSRDCEDVNMKIVKHVIQGIVKPLTHICNTSFGTSTFPNSMKKSKSNSIVQKW